MLYIIPLFFLAKTEDKSIIASQSAKYSIIIIALVMSVYSIVGNYGLTRMAYLSSRSTSRAKKVSTKNNVEQYAINNPGKIYVYDYSLALTGDPFVTYEKGKPYNLMFWGGSGMFSPPYYEQLAANGLNEFYSDRFFDENVFFMNRKEPHADLLAYMRDEYSDTVTTEVVDRQDGFIVYRFKRGN